MDKMMQAVSIVNGKLAVRAVRKPENPPAGHLILRMEASGINPGDKLFVAGGFTPGGVPVSRDAIGGVSAVGTVIATGNDVPADYRDRQVAIYRSLVFSEAIVGVWSEYVQIPYLSCVLLPEGVDAMDYTGSLVNIITPYAFVQQILAEGHRGIIATAGNSATGIAMLGICQAYGVPLISIVRNQESKRELESLGAPEIIVSENQDAAAILGEQAKTLSATAVFDGVGGAAINPIIEQLAPNSTIYAYGYLGGQTPYQFHSRLLQKGISLKGFGNFRTRTVQDPLLLRQALMAIGSMIDRPHFKTKRGRLFAFGAIEEAMGYVSSDGSKAVLMANN